MMDFFSIMSLPLLACLVLTGIHSYLGMHVVQRQVIFVDLALAQIAVLGMAVGLLLGHYPGSLPNYWLALGFTVIGAVIFSVTRLRDEVVPHEAIIGIVYVVASALMFILLSFSGEGIEHMRQAFMGNILLIGGKDLFKITVIYAAVGLFHYMFREKFFLISRDPETAFKKGIKVRLWDFLFYTTFGIVVTSSVALAGVLLVFSYLVIPAVVAVLLVHDLRARLVVGWVIGVLGSILGLAVSYSLDIPTGSSVVCALAAILIAVSLYQKFLGK